MVSEKHRIVYVGLDDTDTVATAGTNSLARQLANALPEGFTFVMAVRHQLLRDSRIPYTSGNSCASLLLWAEPDVSTGGLFDALRRRMVNEFVAGSDPGLCIAEQVPPSVSEFAGRCQRELVDQNEARGLAAKHDILLHGLGGTEDGVIGALAAVGLLAVGDDGRVVHLPGWPWPDTAAGPQTVSHIRKRGVHEVRVAASGVRLDRGVVDVGRRLRPNYRDRRVVLFVERDTDVNGASLTGSCGAEQRWRGLKLP